MQAAAAAEARAMGRKPPSSTSSTTTTSNSSSSNRTGTGTRATAATVSTAGQQQQPHQRLTDEQNMELIKYAGIAIGGTMILKVILNSLLMLYIALVPILIVYALQTCPTPESFEAKKEIKRVMRGYHLPENHPNKPKGYFEQMAARVAATVTTELATIPGYEITMTTLGGIAMMANVTIPTVKIEYYWIGIFGRWFYVYSRELSTNRND